METHGFWRHVDFGDTLLFSKYFLTVRFWRHIIIFLKREKTEMTEMTEQTKLACVTGRLYALIPIDGSKKSFKIQSPGQGSNLLATMVTFENRSRVRQKYFNSKPREGSNLLATMVTFENRSRVRQKYFNSKPREGSNLLATC